MVSSVMKYGYYYSLVCLQVNVLLMLVHKHHLRKLLQLLLPSHEETS